MKFDKQQLLNSLVIKECLTHVERGRHHTSWLLSMARLYLDLLLTQLTEETKLINKWFFFSAMIVDCMGLIYSMAIYLGEIGTECNTRWNGVHQFKRENWITEIVDHFLTRQDLNIVLLVPNECLEKGTRDVHSIKSQFYNNFITPLCKFQTQV